MQNVNTSIYLDIYNHDTTPSVIKAISLDSHTRFVSAVIQDRGALYDIGQDATVTLTVIRPDGTGVQITGQPEAHTDITPEGTEVTTHGAYAELSQTALAVKGTLKAQFMFTSGEQVLRTEIFTINCGEALDASTDTWAGEYQGYNLDELVQNVNEASAKVDAMEDDVSDLKEGLNEITEKMKKVVSENKWDTENETVGAITANGTVYPNYTSYVYPNTPIEVNEGDVVRSYEINAGGGFATAGMRWLCAYDAEMNPVTASGSNSNITSYTVPAGIKYIRPSFNSGGQKRMLTINYEASSWINYEVHYEAGDEFHTDIKMAQTNFGELYLDYSMLNRLDPTDCQTGKFINGTTGAISDNASYYVTNYMEIRSGETLYFMQRDTKVAVNARTVAVYDANKTLLDTLGTNTSTDHFTQTGKAAFIRCSFAYSASDIIRTPYGIGVMTSATPKYVTGYGDVPTISKDSIRPVINVYATDSEQSIISKFVQAFNRGACDVVFERASYSFGIQLATVKDDYHLFENEIPIGNGCRYFFNGATLTALISPSSTPSCNFFGCQKRPSSYELHDGVLIAYGTVYVVHDESSAYVGTYKHLYQNMEMHYNSNSRTDEIRKCIGGGTGASGVVEIVGCKFTTDAVDACVSYHGNGTDVTGAEFDLSVRDSYFSNGLRAGELSAHQTARLFYTGNSSASAPLSYARWTVTSFLNEIRG